jgi:hypothetical protein
MKSNCSLNNQRSKDYPIETKKNICSACIDADHIDCNEGLQIIKEYNQQEETAKETRAKLIAILESQKHENPRKETEKLVMAEFGKIMVKIANLKLELKKQTQKETDIEKRLDNLGR